MQSNHIGDRLYGAKAGGFNSRLQFSCARFSVSGNKALDVVKLGTCPRSCNVAAHNLAAYGAGLGNGNFEISVGHFPDFVTNSVAGDSAGMY